MVKLPDGQSSRGLGNQVTYRELPDVQNPRGLGNQVAYHVKYDYYFLIP